MYKRANGISREIMNDVFQIRNNTHYNLRYAATFLAEHIHSAFNGSESASYVDPKLWNKYLMTSK